MTAEAENHVVIPNVTATVSSVSALRRPAASSTSGEVTTGLGLTLISKGYDSGRCDRVSERPTTDSPSPATARPRAGDEL